MNRIVTVLILICLKALFAHAWAQSVFYVTDYGAVADTTILSTDAMQRAIDACAESGGGTVVIPPGDYQISALELRDNVNLHIEAGAIVYASRNTLDYKDKTIRKGAADMSEAEVMVYAFGCNNVSVTGKGSLHARAVREQFRREPQTSLRDSVTGREIENAIVYGVDYQTKYRKVPPCPGIINFTGCRNVTLSDFSAVESSGWGVHLQWCTRVNINGLNIYSDGNDGVNSDGLDIDGCSNVTISDCVIDTGDDALCLKTTSIDGESYPCRNIAVTNCILTSSSSAFKIGTESHDYFENITVSNCIIRDANRGICMIIRDGGDVRNVIFSGIVMSTVRKATFWWGNGDAVWLTTQARRGAPYSGKIDNVIFSNIIAHGQSGVRLEGFDSSISNITFSDFQMFMEPENAVDKRARNGFLFDGVKDLKIKSCDVKWNTEYPEEAWESAFYFKKVDGLKIYDVDGESAPNGRYDALRFGDVNNLVDYRIKN